METLPITACSFEKDYHINGDNFERSYKEAGRKSIKKWYAKVGEFDNKAFNDIAAAMYDREDEILNYFVNRSTNASAESLNAKIKDFRAQLRGVIDKKFFIFRLVKIFG